MSEESLAKKIQRGVFNELYAIDTRDRSVEKNTGKTKLNYLPWATTYSEVCKRFDEVEYHFLRQTVEVEEIEETVVDEKTTAKKVKKYYQELPYFDTGKGLEVRTEVTIDGITKEMSLPVYDASYKSMGNEAYTYSTKYGDKTVGAAKFDDIYKSILRCFAKNLSMFGVGINLWTKEETSEVVLNIEKLQKECLALMKQKASLSDEASKKVETVSKDMLAEENGDPTLCTDSEILEALKKKLKTIRK